MSYWRCTQHDTLQHVKHECVLCVDGAESGQPWEELLKRARATKALDPDRSADVTSVSYAQGVIDFYNALPVMPLPELEAGDE